MRPLTPPERLVVAADFKPTTSNSRNEVWNKVMELAEELRDTGVYLKVNSALRVYGYKLIRAIKYRGLRVFADLKLDDIPSVLEADGMYLAEEKPEIVTVACTAGIPSMRTLQAKLPETEVLGVTVLTNMEEASADSMFTCSVNGAVMRLARTAKEAEISGLVCSPKEVLGLRTEFGDRFTLNTAGIRPEGLVVENDDQNPARVMTPEQAMQAGADRIIVGRPITQSTNRRETALRIIEAISQ